MKLRDVTLGAILTQYDDRFSDVEKIDSEIDRLNERRSALIDELVTLSATYELLTGKPISLAAERKARLDPDASISDLAHLFLKERGAMTMPELREVIQRVGRLKSRNARNVLTNALNREPERFEFREDGKIVLRKEKK
jgi:hypothetical protein